MKNRTSTWITRDRAKKNTLRKKISVIIFGRTREKLTHEGGKGVGGEKKDTWGDFRGFGCKEGQG
jgi:hypothetical protein